jgi:hypothetical protein
MTIGDLQAFADVVLAIIVSEAHDSVVDIFTCPITLARKNSLSRCKRSNAVG